MNEHHIIEYLLFKLNGTSMSTNNTINSDSEVLSRSYGVKRRQYQTLLMAINERNDGNYYDIPDISKFPDYMKKIVIQVALPSNWAKQYLQTSPTWRTPANTFLSALGTVGDSYTETLTDIEGKVLRATNDVRQFNGEKKHYTYGGKFFWVQNSFNKILVYNGVTAEFIKEITIPGTVGTPNDKIANACAHPTDEDVIIIPDGATLKAWNIDSNTVSTITTFSQNLTVGGTVGDANDFAGNLLAIGLGGEYAVYDLATDEIVTEGGRQAVDGSTPEPTFALSNVDYIRVSPDGRNIVLVLDSELADQGIKLLDLNGQVVDTLYTHDGHVGFALIVRQDNKEWNCIVTKMVVDEPIVDAKKGDIVSIFWRFEGDTLIKDVKVCFRWPDEFSTLSGGQYAYSEDNKVFYLATKNISSEAQVSDNNDGFYYEQIIEIDPEGQKGGSRRLASTYGSDTNVQRQIELFPLYGGQWLAYRTPIGTTNGQCYMLAIKVPPKVDEQIIREQI